jgi:ABC-type phosphate/phosphonate transport system substrate-binding protein
MNLLRAEKASLAKGEPFFQSVALTGPQGAGAEMVAAGKADLTALDALAYDHLQRFRPELAAELRLLAWTVRAPGPPLVTSALADLATREALQLALRLTAEDPAQRDAMNDLRLDGFNVLPLSHYRAVLYLEQIAVDQGYPRLA